MLVPCANSGLRNVFHNRDNEPVSPRRGTSTPTVGPNVNLDVRCGIGLSTCTCSGLKRDLLAGEVAQAAPRLD